MSGNTILKCVTCFCTLWQNDEKKELICISLVLFLPLIRYEIFLQNEVNDISWSYLTDSSYENVYENPFLQLKWKALLNTESKVDTQCIFALKMIEPGEHLAQSLSSILRENFL